MDWFVKGMVVRNKFHTETTILITETGAKCIGIVLSADVSDGVCVGDKGTYSSSVMELISSSIDDSEWLAADGEV